MKLLLLPLLLGLCPLWAETHYLKYNNCDLFDPPTTQMLFMSSCVSANFQGVNTFHDRSDEGYIITIWDIQYESYSTIRVNTSENSCLISFYSDERSEISYLQFKQNVDMFLGEDSQELEWLDGYCWQ